MKRADCDHFKQQLLAQREALQAGAADRDEAGATVALDQQRVGRLSRMDALQMQAMARAEQARAVVLLKQIDAALKRLDNGEYGDCVKCDEPIAPARLEANPATPFCAGCAP